MSDSVAQQQMAQASGLASNTGYRTAPQDVQGVGQPEPQGLLKSLHGIKLEHLKAHRICILRCKFFLLCFLVPCYWSSLSLPLVEHV